MQILSRERGRNHTDNILILDRDKCVFLQEGEGRKEGKQRKKKKAVEENLQMKIVHCIWSGDSIKEY